MIIKCKLNFQIFKVAKFKSEILTNLKRKIFVFATKRKKYIKILLVFFGSPHGKLYYSTYGPWEHNLKFDPVLTSHCTQLHSFNSKIFLEVIFCLCHTDSSTDNQDFTN